ncbi:PREDICTED: uncharacterized protein LOC105363541 [Ceratosolen solmsi marchali]|uniref:Uncharacterized protein LOC105363541 n=1 Tax=Ceratosolen solmsi marchali TaxID=326594 RepID=A0AAJ7DX27_9HYME|nr:PREDICTED: uncharacterized protein LOC105363541 [Ceratosolen solmsi marchali]
MEYLRSALSCFGLGGEVGAPIVKGKEEEQGCDRCRSHGARLTDTERNIDKLWSAAHTLRNRLDQCDTDLEMILHWFNRVTYSPTYITEEPETISGFIIGDAAGQDNRNESFNTQAPTIIER